MDDRTFKLSPSDFAFLWEDCKRCFYLKVVHDIRQPRTPMAKIFNIIDSKMKQYYSDKRAETIAEGIPPGQIEYSEKWVESAPLSVPAHKSKFFIRGKFDTAFLFDDRTFGVVDFKTSERRDEHIPLYSRQLHAYALSLENPGPGQLELKPISRLGLLVFSPEIYTQGKSGMVGLAGKANWIEIPRDDAMFMNFISQVLEVLEQDSPPEPRRECPFCSYREMSRRKGI